MIAFETDIHAVAGLLKRYFRELPDPLFTDELYMSFVQALGEAYLWTHNFHSIPLFLFCDVQFPYSIPSFLHPPFSHSSYPHSSCSMLIPMCCAGLSDPEARDQCLISLLHSLPPVNFKTAVFLFKHLRR